MTIRVEITGLKELEKTGQLAIEQKEKLRAEIRAEVVWFGSNAMGTSRERFLSGRPGLNVITGRLRSSIGYEVEDTKTGFTMSLGTSVPYAPVHEYGDRRGYIRPRPFLRPAVEAEYPRFLKEIDNVLSRFAEGGLGQ